MKPSSGNRASLVKARRDADGNFPSTQVGRIADPCPKKPLWIRLALDPAQAPACFDRFEVRSTDGAYNQTKTVSTDHLVNETSVDLEFTDAFIDKNYDIRVLPREGAPYSILRNVPYAQLGRTSSSEPPQPLALHDQPKHEEVMGYDDVGDYPEPPGGGVLA